MEEANSDWSGGGCTLTRAGIQRGRGKGGGRGHWDTPMFPLILNRTFKTYFSDSYNTILAEMAKETSVLFVHPIPIPSKKSCIDPCLTTSGSLATIIYI